MAAERLTDDLLVEILSRVPARSLCRFKCVSNHWLSLIDHPFHRKKLPQTLAGFFHTGNKYKVPKSPLRFISVPGSRCPLMYPYLAFLPDHMGSVHVLDCCNGLLLCRRSDVGDDQFRVSYVVCNPTTGQWTVLPEASHLAGKVGMVRLGFDPAVSSNFYVFVLLECVDNKFELNICAVDVYSSETGRWVHKEKRCTKEEIGLLDREAAAVFLNGCLHFHAYCSKLPICIGAVDMHGVTWTTFGIPLNPQNEFCVSRWRNNLTGGGFIQQSHGCLHHVSFQRGEHNDVVGLVVYVLEDYGNKEWVLKHSVRLHTYLERHMLPIPVGWRFIMLIPVGWRFIRNVT